LLVYCTACAVEGAAVTNFEIVSAESAKIAVPEGWRSFDGLERSWMIYRQGDAIGVPAIDEAGSPLQIGLTVEKLPASRESTETIARALSRTSTENPELVLVGQESIEAVELSDQTQATFVTAEFIKGRTRRSLYMKLIAKDDKSQVWIATAYLVGSKSSQLPKPDSKLATWLRAHLVSLTLTGKEVDLKKVEAAYQVRDSEKTDEIVLEDAVTPTAGLTGSWSGWWHYPQSRLREAFTMDLVQQGTNVTGTAVFMDAHDTKVEITGQMTGMEIRLLMRPAASHPAAPTTTWTGALTNKTISGVWQINGKPDGSPATGPWSANIRK